MAEALVHIGLHKTGTTSFQQWAVHHASTLQTTLGIRPYQEMFNWQPYELSLLALRPGRTSSAMLLQPEWPLDGWRRQVADHCRLEVAADDSALLISSEGLSLLRYEDEVETLRDLLAPRQIRVAVCMRQRDAWLRSYRSQLLRHGESASEFRESHAYLGPDTWLVEWDDMLRVWRKVLGHDNVVAFSYEDTIARYGSSIPGVLAALGIPPDRAPSWEGFVANVSPDHEGPFTLASATTADRLRTIIRANPYGWPLQLVEAALRRVRLRLTSPTPPATQA
jgi:hypothetical protein